MSSTIIVSLALDRSYSSSFQLLKWPGTKSWDPLRSCFGAQSRFYSSVTLVVRWKWVKLCWNYCVVFIKSSTVSDDISIVSHHDRFWDDLSLSYWILIRTSLPRQIHGLVFKVTATQEIAWSFMTKQLHEHLTSTTPLGTIPTKIRII